jgi:hypothetical protein
MKIGTPPRDAQGRPQPFIDPSVSEPGRWFAYSVTVDGKGWRCVGIFDDENAARSAVGLPLVFT